MRVKKPPSAPVCPYCDRQSQLVHGQAIYPHRPDLWAKPFWQCEPCEAYVGCHPGTKNALGRLANDELRKAKQAAHAAFDPLWRGGQQHRKSAYLWLAERMGMIAENCHIGMMDVEACRRVVEVCKVHRRTAK